MESTITTEDQLQAACTQWFWNSFPLQRRMLFHVDNNSWNRVVGAKKKALGVVSGPSDLIFILCGEVVFIEMKTPTGTQSDEQKDFQLKVSHRGHQYIIIRTLDQFKSFICLKLNDNGRR